VVGSSFLVLFLLLNEQIFPLGHRAFGFVDAYERPFACRPISHLTFNGLECRACAWTAFCALIVSFFAQESRLFFPLAL